MKLYAARHGETTWNVEKRILGHTPGELTDKGIAQAAELTQSVQQLSFTKAFASDLARVRSTVEAVQEISPDLMVEFTPQLRERDFGELEGKLMSEVDWEGFWALPDSDTRYNAESLADFTRRIALFMINLDTGGKDKSVAILTHIGVMNRLNYLSNPSDFTFINYPNADVTEFDFEAILRNSRQFTKD